MRLMLVVSCVLSLLGGCRNNVGGGADEDDVPPSDAGEGEGEGEGEVDAGDGGCPAAPVDGLVVSIKDTSTDFPLCDATVTANDGNGPQPLRVDLPYPDCTYLGATNAPGTYALHAEKVGYAARDLTGVTVRPLEGCATVQTVYLSLDLTPAL